MRLVARPIVLLALAACSGAASSAPPPKLAVTGVTETTSAVAPADAETATETPPVGVVTTLDRNDEAVADADAVFDALEGDVLACYHARLKKDPGAHAFLTVDVVVNPDGTVRSVTTTGGARLGDEGLSCIQRRIERATFLPVWNGGTRHLSVPFELRRSLDGR